MKINIADYNGLLMFLAEKKAIKLLVVTGSSTKSALYLCENKIQDVYHGKTGKHLLKVFFSDL
jgi:hypothetical protein